MGLERARRGVMAMDVGACVLQLLRLEVYDGAARSRMSVRERARACGAAAVGSSADGRD